MRSVSLVRDLRRLVHIDQIPRSPRSRKPLDFVAEMAVVLETPRRSHSAALRGKPVYNAHYALVHSPSALGWCTDL
jgi:hypothetical protein